MTSSKISYAEANSNLGRLLDRVVDNKDIIIIKRNSKDKNAALIEEEDPSSLLIYSRHKSIDNTEMRLLLSILF